MDTTREYIEMSKELPDEMLSAWEPNAGDFVFAIHGYSDYDYRKELDNGVLGIITKVQEDTFSIEPFKKSDAVAWYSIKHSIPLWRQDQLQDMLPKQGRWRKTYDLIEQMDHYIDNPHFLFESMEQLWLALVVDKKYNKAWNDKEWIKC